MILCSSQLLVVLAQSDVKTTSSLAHVVDEMTIRERQSREIDAMHSCFVGLVEQWCIRVNIVAAAVTSCQLGRGSGKQKGLPILWLRCLTSGMITDSQFHKTVS